MLHGVVSVAILSVLVGVSGTDNEYKGTQFTFTNNCKNELSLIARINDQGDHELKDLQPFEQYVYNVSNEVCEHGNVRAGTSLEATLFEFSTCEGENKINSMVFFDGSIIAPTLTSKDCTDATDCGGVGFNVGMQISAMSLRTGQRIPDRKCSDPFHCEAFYSSPHQDTATTAVDAPAIITITFCPDEAGGSPPVPAGAPGKPCII